MGKITLKLRCDRRTGKKDILVEYESDEDATGFEHERRHRRIVEELIAKGVLDREELGQVVRVRPGTTVAVGDAAGEPEAEASKQGSS